MVELPGPHELVLLLLVIAVLAATGLWPRVIRALRELRGERQQETAPSRSDVALACKMLGVAPSTPWADIEAAYRRKAKIHHPDKGGDDDAMRALNDAYALLKQVRREQGSHGKD
ncbi:MAG TPA: DnaJ domain-containing protein [Candidatus Hydrogenedentes bacterium]|nr:DnaJ domain-containing protein [Candidatus Hydrogenedentota bacterium]